MSGNSDPPNSVKYQPTTGNVAIRTSFDETGDFAHLAWLIVKVNGIATPAGSDKLNDDDWVDTFHVVNGQIVLPE